MNNYTELSKTIDLALEELRQRLDYNTSRNEAKEEGREEGLEEKEKEIILNMHKKGISKEDIADMTGINIEKINKTLNM